ncbi:hypothetical protein D3C84_624930 [compost metagenome]
MGGEGVDEQHLFPGFRVGAHHRMLGIGVLGLERQAFFDRHGRAEAGLDAVTGAQAFDFLLHVFGQAVVGLDHVHPHGVATDRRALDAAQHTAHGRCIAPGGVGVPGVLVAVHGLVRALVDLHQARMLRVAASHRVVFQLAETASESHVLGTGNVLIAQEYHTVLDQLSTNFGEKAVVVDSVSQVDANEFRTNVIC